MMSKSHRQNYILDINLNEQEKKIINDIIENIDIHINVYIRRCILVYISSFL